MRISDWSSDVCSSDLLPLLVFVVTVLAVPLSKVNPRQGRFLKLLPAILLYMTYLALLIAARGWLDKGRIPATLGLWWVHGLFFAIGMLMLYWEPLRLAISKRRDRKSVGQGKSVSVREDLGGGRIIK